MSQRVVEVLRGPIEESHHSGDIAVVNSQGKLLWHVGDANRMIFARSSAKPLQALPLVESGAAEYFQMTDEEIAVTCASHNGEESHVELIFGFLQRIGIDASKLACGVHAPYHAPSHEALLLRGERYTALHNNCSGKHAGMLALAKFMQADLDTYLSLEHPVQQAILSAVSGMTNVPVKDIGIGTDGCGVPVHALPLRQYAFAYARFVDPGDLPATRRQAVARISHAMRDYPYMVAGKDRFCTRLMEKSGGDILGKAGAEGVYCVGVESEKYGICVKIDDGNGRAVDAVMLETLKQLQAIPQTVLEELRDYHYKLLKNHAGTVVGEIKPNFTLLQA